MKAKAPRARLFVPVIAFSGAVAAAVACYGPTEVVVDLSTDLDCSASIRTAVYRGEPFRTTPETETTSCTPGGGTSEIGTLTVLPSGSDDGDAAIKAVLAIGGKDPTTCDADPTNCIVATRSFSFVAHTTRRVPIILSQECLGTKCPEGQTCGAGGACISNAVTCSGAGCSLPGESDGGAKKRNDAGADASGPGSDAGSSCGDFGAPPVLAGVPPSVLSTATADTIYFATLGTGTVYGITKTASGASGKTTVATVAIVAGQISVLSAQANTLLIAYSGTSGPFARIKAFVASGSATPDRDVKLLSPALAFGRDGSNQIVIATAKGIFSVGPSDTASTLLSIHDVHALVSTVDAPGRVAAVYALEVDGGVDYFADAGLTSEPKVVLPTASVLRASSAFAYAVVPQPTPSGTGAAPGFWQIDGGATTRISGPPASMTLFAVDATSIYGVPDGTSLHRWELDGGQGVVLDKPNVPIVHVFVDDRCAYYWTEDPAAGGALYVRPKSK